MLLSWQTVALGPRRRDVVRVFIVAFLIDKYLIPPGVAFILIQESSLLLCRVIEHVRYSVETES